MNQSDSSEKPTILVVDDEPDNLALMSSLLKRDYKVKVAGSGEKALKIAASEAPPDLILLDIMMPGMDGYEVCRRIKRDPQTRNIQVIFITAKAEMADEIKGLELGAIDFITKPISPPIVMARVRNHLALKAMADFLHDQNDWDTAQRLAVTLKGLSGSIGLVGLQHLAEKLEIEIQAHRSSKKLTDRIDQPTLVAQTAQELPLQTENTAVMDNRKKLKTVCVHLEALLADNNVEARDVLDAHAELLDAAFPEHCHEIDNNIRSFDFEAALVALRAAAGRAVTPEKP